MTGPLACLLVRIGDEDGDGNNDDDWGKFRLGIFVLFVVLRDRDTHGSEERDGERKAYRGEICRMDGRTINGM